MSTWRSGWRSAFQSTLPVWGATSHIPYQLEHFPISIHAPRVGSDLHPKGGAAHHLISIHAPRVGSDFSEPSLTRWICYFNPRSPCGERRISAFHGLCADHFNPRSPCGERRRIRGGRNIPCQIFQSTLPVWGATVAGGDHPDGHGISIHAPRVGSDSSPRLTCSRRRNFNPRSPCGERHVPVELWMQRVGISIHAPRVGSDSGSPTTASPSNNFNPRSPCGERPGGIPPHG